MKELLLVIINASIKAGEAIMEIYDGEHNVQLKHDESPLTQADLNANSVINSFLKNTGIPIISEENKQTDYTTRKHWNKCWIVDPLDGTKEFIKRNGEFTVNIALIEKGKPVLGVIFVPVTKTLYFTNLELNSSFKLVLPDYDGVNEKALQDATSIRPSKKNENVLRLVGSRSHMNDETKAYIESFRKTGKQIEIVAVGSSLKFCLIAEGKADIYPRFAPTMEWDTAAGQAICEAVGISVISMESKSQMTYNKENLLNSHFLVKPT